MLFVLSYRTADEVKTKRKEEDPIVRLEKYAIEGNLMTEEEMKVQYVMYLIPAHTIYMYVNLSPGDSNCHIGHSD